MPLAHSSSWLHQPAALGIALGLLLVQPAWAENPTATEPLDVQVELAGGLSLSCTTLDFGTVFLEDTGDSDKRHDTQIFVFENGNVELWIGSRDSAHAGDGGPAQCTITGASPDVGICGSIIGGSGFFQPTGSVPPDTDFVGGFAELSRTTNPQAAYQGRITARLFVPRRPGNPDPGDWVVRGISGDTSACGIQGARRIVNTGSESEHTFAIGGSLNILSGFPFNPSMAGTYTGFLTIEIEETDPFSNF